MHLLATHDLCTGLEVPLDERVEVQGRGAMHILDGVEIVRLAPRDLQQDQVVCFGDQHSELRQALQFEIDQAVLE